MKNKFLNFTLIIAISLILTACGKKSSVVAPTPTLVPQIVEMPVDSRPIISLTPREDGHMLYLQLTSVPSTITSIEYELIYTAIDGTLEIEKGLGDTIKDVTTTLERKLLLGTESCTSGCKYKYDEGVTGGTLSLKFIDNNGQMSKYESPFTLKKATDLNKDKSIKLAIDNFEVPIKVKIPNKDFFVLIKQYKGGYSIFSNGTNPLIGDYPRP